MKKLLATLTLLHYISISSIESIEDIQEFNLVIRHSKKPVLVIFSTHWCSICNFIKGPIEELVNKGWLYNTISVINIDYDKAIDIRKQEKIENLPTFCYFKNGLKIHQDVGVKNKEKFIENLEKSIANKFDLVNPNQPTITASNDRWHKKFIAKPLKLLRNSIDWCINYLEL